jgi:hypothetical protein
VRRTHYRREARAIVNIDSSHQVKAEQGQIRQVVASQFFAAQVCVHKAQAAKPITGDAHAFEVGHFNPSRIAHDYIFNVTLAIDEGANLASRFMRQLAELTREFRSYNLMWWNAPLIELLNAP